MATKMHPSKLAISPPTAASSPCLDSSPSPHPSTPSAASPASYLAMKPASACHQTATPVALHSKTSITSKEWVIPPRPKPGRKPATDTPPTKRKAQNRAAQRAFRERRAARVGELEEELDEKREEHERSQQQLHRQIKDLTAEIETLRRDYNALRDTLTKERAERIIIVNDLESLQRRLRDEASGTSSITTRFMPNHGRIQSLPSQNHPTGSSSTSYVPEQHNSTSAFSFPQVTSPLNPSGSLNRPQALENVSGCGNCRSSGACACVDEMLTKSALECENCGLGTGCECPEAAHNNSVNITMTDADLKRKSSTTLALAPDEKRQKAEIYPNEIDFTATFSRKNVSIAVPPPSESMSQVQPLLAPRESCGFCTESSYCMCAESAAAPMLPPMSQQVQTPPHSEDDAGPPPMEVTSTGAIKLPGINSLNRNSFQTTRDRGGCGTSGPGTCAQCLRDPKSGLFCRSLAATFARESGSTAGGCCGGSTGASGCCKSLNPPAQAPSISSGVSLSCADAYQTLSSHPGFERATDELETWLPKLKAVPKPTNTSSRTALDVETASIMGVLKEFDVRFGRNK